MKVVGIIPARYGSTRFPGKPLVALCGRPMIRWVHEAVARCTTVDSVVVATDDERIGACVEAFGGRVTMTSPDHPSGTDRLAEAAAVIALSDEDVVVNVQGDEPLLEPGPLDDAVRLLLGDPAADVATLAAPIREAAEFHDPAVVKVVVGPTGRALWFSRAPIPWPRDDGSSPPSPPTAARRHVGVYAYRVPFLRRFAAWEPAPLERVERLEQLRALEHGARILVAPTSHATLAVDSPSDVAPVEARLRERLGPAD